MASKRNLCKFHSTLVFATVPYFQVHLKKDLSSLVKEVTAHVIRNIATRGQPSHRCLVSNSNSTVQRKHTKCPMIEERQLVEIFRQVSASILLREEKSLRSINSHLSCNLTLTIMIAMDSVLHLCFL